LFLWDLYSLIELIKLHIVTHTCNPTTSEAEVGISSFQSHFGQQGEFKAVLSYTKQDFASKQTNKQTKQTQQRINKINIA
jgi:Mn-containing catalase